jgi:hypothetical protein
MDNKNTENTDELWKRYEITKEVLERPLDVTKHEDEKAARILASIAFLTLATTSVFSTFQNKGIKLELSIFYQPVDLILLFFVGYLIFVILGTIFMLNALGPNFELPIIWRTSAESQENVEKKTYKPDSIFFFKKISEEDRNQWVNYFEGNLNEILDKACSDHIFEAHLVSTKVEKKVKSIDYGKRFFLGAMLIFIFLMIFGFYVYTFKSP